LGQALSLYEQINDLAGWLDTLVDLAWLRLFQGRLNVAAQGFAEVIAAAQTGRPTTAVAAGLLGQAVSQIRLGDDRSEETLARLESAVGFLNHHPDRSMQLMAYGLLAGVQQRRGHSQAAATAVEQGFTLLEETAPLISRFWAMEGTLALAESYLVLKAAEVEPGEVKQPGLVTLFEPIRRALQKLGQVLPISQPGIWLWQGRYEVLLGQPGQAQATWQKSLSQAERLGMPYEQAMAGTALGQHIGQAETAGEEYLAQASKLLDQLRAG
jgi:hypothetical protein